MGRNAIPENVIPLTGKGTSVNDRILLASKLRPSHLSEDAAEVWDRIAADLSVLGRLKPHFVDVFSEYCQTICEYKDLYAFIQEETYRYEVKGRNGRQQKSWPEVAQFNEVRRHLGRLRSELGLSPSAEKRLIVGQGELPFEDPFDSFD